MQDDKALCERLEKAAKNVPAWDRALYLEAAARLTALVEENEHLRTIVRAMQDSSNGRAALATPEDG